MHPQFDDLARAALMDDHDASARAERDEIVRELTAAHAAELPFHDRLAGALARPIRVRLAPCSEIEGTLLRVGRDHIWVADARGSWLLVTAEIDGVHGLPSAVPKRSSSGRPTSIGLRGLGSALRELVGADGQVSLLIGDRWFDGRLRQVGADFVEIDDLSVSLSRVRACRVWY